MNVCTTSSYNWTTGVQFVVRLIVSCMAARFNIRLVKTKLNTGQKTGALASSKKSYQFETTGLPIALSEYTHPLCPVPRPA